LAGSAATARPAAKRRARTKGFMGIRMIQRKPGEVSSIPVGHEKAPSSGAVSGARFVY
jgi:hypothetical protein